MIKILGFVVARESEMGEIKGRAWSDGYGFAYKVNQQKQNVRISPRTGLPVRKYNKRK
jgi:hypothetical protein